MQKPQFVENQIYHIFNRGVEKRKIFMDEKDYFRFMHDLYEFNDEDRVHNSLYFFKRKSNSIEVQPQYIKKERMLLVDILAFVLMPNHFHLILKQRVENGIVKFLHKIGTGYTMYFNKRHERVGSLFQGRFKAVIVLKRAHFIYLPFYLHFNPLELMPNYRGSTSIDKMNFLEKYRWSSFPDYVGIKNFPSITSRNDFLEFFGGTRGYKKEATRYLKDKEFRLDKSLILE